MAATHTRPTRRTFAKFLAAGTLVAAAGTHAAVPAEAGRTWCRLDPVVKIDGGVADVWLESYNDLHAAATGPAEIVVSLPPGVLAQLLAVDRGFGGWGYAVRFVEDATLTRTKAGTPQVRVETHVPSRDGSLPLNVYFAPRSSDLAAADARGRVNTYWVTLKTR